MSNTFLEKKQLKRAILCVILGVLLLGSVPFFVSAYNEIIIDDFETYELGSLNGQGNWISSFEVVDEDSQSGVQSIKASTTEYSFAKQVFPDEDNGIIFYWFRISAGTSVGANAMTLCYGSCASNTRKIMVEGLWNDTTKRYEAVWFDNIGLSHYIATIEANVWYNFQIRWFFDTSLKWNYNFNFYGWSDDITSANPTYTTVNNLLFESYPDQMTNFIDNIGGFLGCSLGNCHLCEHYGTCVGAGCFWVYSLYYLQIDPKMTGWYCTEPYEPEAEECGEMFKCQFCMSEETCGENVSCEWVNRGLGNKCYLKEPTIPPVQVSWEVPELENCEELSGVEKWLCLIKNFIAGIFMPSQEKVNSLFNTFGAFKERFPFNYAGAISNFFSDIKDSLATEKEIPVKILGQESNVSFAFFDKTTTIGGQVETFKNIWLDFTSLMIILAWSVWLIGFIKRIFA